jgi:glucuronokinase
MTTRGQAFPRAALAGNPSDGYFGKTIAFTFRNFAATVELEESAELEIVPEERDRCRFASAADLIREVKLHGYYGGLRLLKAAITRFHEHAAQSGIALPQRNFTIRYATTIPSRLGLAGSSAILTAAFRALMAFHGVTLPKPTLANVVLACETEELHIPAGLQDRVAQAYNGLVYMDFDREIMQRQGYGRYDPLDLRLLPPIYIAYRAELAEGTEVFHNDIRGRWERGEPAVREAMTTCASLAELVRARLVKGQGASIGPLLDSNFDMRRRIYRIGEGNLRMIEAARSAGASANFAGSGGAIVGTYEDAAMFERLVEKLGAVGARVIQPEYVPPED